MIERVVRRVLTESKAQGPAPALALQPLPPAPQPPAPQPPAPQPPALNHQHLNHQHLNHKLKLNTARKERL